MKSLLPYLYDMVPYVELSDAKICLAWTKQCFSVMTCQLRTNGGTSAIMDFKKYFEISQNLGIIFMIEEFIDIFGNVLNLLEDK